MTLNYEIDSVIIFHPLITTIAAGESDGPTFQGKTEGAVGVLSITITEGRQRFIIPRFIHHYGCPSVSTTTNKQ